ncbi:heme-binding protein [Asticcacaulis sp.]|uniref:SOUL family heme-binding protein n=1 Tax=Asticcacaulis sp. TaxID=1872648 RepID=UPI002611BCCD|nr:heme-binding protein [Asticcacaulis sp.]
MSIEEPAYTTSQKEGLCEVRAYPSLIAAEVTVSGEREPALRAGFNLLAGYIFGSNVQKHTVAMTAPVLQAPQSEKIAMTAPVIQQAVADGWVVRFIMPVRYTLATLPKPNNPRVRLVNLPPVRVAVIRFAGRGQAGDIEARTEGLEIYMRHHKLNAIGPISMARYDPPWTLWFLRRNELMVPVG